jgi:hypothetical protein
MTAFAFIDAPDHDRGIALRGREQLLFHDPLPDRHFVKCNARAGPVRSSAVGRIQPRQLQSYF